MTDHTDPTSDGAEYRFTRRGALTSGIAVATGLGMGTSDYGSAIRPVRGATTGPPTQQQAKLTPDDGDADDEFGYSVAVDGDTAVVGAPNDEDPNGSEAGSAYVFVRSGGTWSEQAKLTPSDSADADLFGTAVAVDSDRVIVGASRNDATATDAGSAYVFERSGGSWSEATQLLADDGDAADNFGNAVAYDGSSVLVGARHDEDPNGSDAGSAYVFVGNEPPTASFTVAPEPVVRGEPATFDASGSADPDGSIAAYEWDFDGDGTYEATGQTVTHTFTTGGDQTVTLRVTDDDGATATTSMTVTVHIRADIAIKPGGNGPRPINPNSGGKIPVGVLQTAEFDPTTELDRSSVHFGDPDDVGFSSSDSPTGGATPAHGNGHIEDVDKDGDDDMMFHFPTQDADFEADDDEVKLVGLTNGGVPVFGTDEIKIVGGGNGTGGGKGGGKGP